MQSGRLKIPASLQTYLYLLMKRVDDAWVVTWNSQDLASLAEVAEVQGRPCPAHWENLAAVVFAEVHCPSFLPYRQVLASCFQGEYLTYRWGDEGNRRLVVPVGMVDQVASPFVFEAGIGAQDAACEGHLQGLTRYYSCPLDENSDEGK